MSNEDNTEDSEKWISDKKLRTKKALFAQKEKDD